MSLHRRRVLAGADAAVLATVGARRRDGAAPARAADFGALARAMDGRLVRPGDRDYAEARRLFQPRYDAVVPGAVAYPAHAGAVAVCLDFARRSALPMVAARRRPQLPGWSTRAAGLVVDAGSTAAVAVERDEGDKGDEGDKVRIGAGAQLAGRRDAYYGPNLPQLEEVRRAYDPDRLFRFPHAV